MNLPPFLNGMSRSNLINQLTQGYGAMAAERVEVGWLPYLLVLKYRHLGGRPCTALTRMQREAKRVYATLLTRVWRNPHAEAYRSRLPLWILVPDFPVSKREKVSLRSLLPNDGLHLQGVAVMPPGSRLREGLDHRFARYGERYCPPGSILEAVHATFIESNLDYVNEYNMKALRNGRASFDDVLLLPRSDDEMRYVPRRATEPWRPPVLDR